MQKTLNAVAAVAICLMWAITFLALYGAHPLPARIPVHFDAEGHVNGWGAPGMLWVMPAIVTGVFLLMSWVTRHPHGFNYPVRVTAANRPVLQSLAIATVGWIKVEIVCLFAWIQWATIESARRGASAISPWSIPVGILIVWFTIGWYFVAMRRTARR